MAAELTQRHPLKAYDAVQLAVAMGHNAILASWGMTIAFLSHDERQLSAAKTEGIIALDPQDPSPGQSG